MSQFIIQVHLDEANCWECSFEQGDPHALPGLVQVLAEQAQELRRTARLSAAHVLSALAAAAQDDTYVAGFALYDFYLASDGESLAVDYDAAQNLTIVLRPLKEAVPPSSKKATLTSLLQLLLEVGTKSQFTHACMASIGLGLAKIYGKLGEPAPLLPLLEQVMTKIGWHTCPINIHVRAAKFALSLMQRGETVPAHLLKFVGDDNGFLKGKFCREPFERMDVHTGREVAVCCGNWLPTLIGSLDDGPTVINSPTIKNIRKSILDGTYKYCDHDSCQWMTHMPPNENFREVKHLWNAIENNETTVEQMRRIIFCLDDSCNLSCPSCRRGKIMQGGEKARKNLEVTRKTIIPLLKDIERLNICPAGELLASKSCREILAYINDETCPNLTLDIISNGTLFNETQWNLFSGIHKKVNSVRISLDSCTKETFEKLRRGANFEQTWENLRFLANLFRNGVFKGFYFSFTYQVDNFREMPRFVEFGREMGVTEVLFEKLMNLGSFTDEEYLEKAVHQPGHPLYPEFLRIKDDPIMQGSGVKFF